MPGARDTRAGGAYVELSLRNQAFIRGLRGSLGQLKAFGASIQSIGAGIGAAGMRMMRYGAGIVAPLLLSARAFGTVGHELTLMSARTGMGVEALSELGYAAELSGAKLEDVEIGIKKMQKAISSGKAGGFDLSGLQGLDPDTQLKAIGDLLTGISDPADRAAAAIALFGRSGTKLLPMLSNMEALRAEARRLGLVMSKEDAQAADTFMDSMERLWAGLKRVSVIVGSALAPMLTELAGDLLDIAVTAGKWFKENKGLIVSLLKIGTAILGAGVLLSSLGGIISAVGTAFVAFSVVGTSALSFLLSPIGMTIAAITGIGLTVAWVTGYAGAALEWLGERFKALKDFALASFQGIADALAAGDIALAAKVLWASVNVVWQAGVNTLKGWWSDFKGWFLTLANDVFWGLATIAVQAFYGVQAAWQKTLNGMSGFLRAFASTVANIWNEITGYTAKKIILIKYNTGQISLDEYYRQVGLTDADTKRWDEDRSAADLKARVAGDEALARDLSDIDAKKNAALATIADVADAEKSARDQKAGQAAFDASEALAAAQEEWALAIEEAKYKKEAAMAGGDLAPAGAAPGMPKPWDIKIPEIEHQLRSQMDVSGSFGSEASDRMGYGSTIAERTAKAAETTAKNTKTISDKLDDAEGILVD